MSPSKRPSTADPSTGSAVAVPGPGESLADVLTTTASPRVTELWTPPVVDTTYQIACGSCPEVVIGVDREDAEMGMAHHLAAEHPAQDHHELVCGEPGCFFVARGLDETVTGAIMEAHLVGDAELVAELSGDYASGPIIPAADLDGATQAVADSQVAYGQAVDELEEITAREDHLEALKVAPLQIGIVGFTPSRMEAPVGRDGWECWGLNNLWAAPDVDPTKFQAWFDLHPRTTIESERPHVEWLAAGADGLPVFLWEAVPEWPTTRSFPVDGILEAFPRYFTNSVSWMAALAILLLKERAEAQGRPMSDCTLGVWGIDMATGGDGDNRGGEYGHQRPSCELFLGMAMGLGIRVEIPETSDLLKSAALYGLEEKSPLMIRLRAMRTDVEQKRQMIVQQIEQTQHELRQLEANFNAMNGAASVHDYVLNVWGTPETTNSTHGLS